MVKAPLSGAARNARAAGRAGPRRVKSPHVFLTPAHIMPHPLFADAGAPAHPIWLVQDETWNEIRDGLPAHAARFAAAQGFEPKAGRHCLLPDVDGSLFGVLFGMDGASAK